MQERKYRSTLFLFPVINVANLSKLQVYAHKRANPPSKDFSWASFEEIGKELAGEVERVAGESPKSPILFIAHSLGGVTLKEAFLSLFYRTLDPAAETAFANVAALVFLGTPHVGQKIRPLSEIYKDVLRADDSKFKSIPDPTKVETHDMHDMTDDFLSKLKGPVLSVFEKPGGSQTKPIKVRESVG
ncbi:hypothetical protein BJX99DRAFT_265264 [Aspergillus californicus]